MEKIACSWSGGKDSCFALMTVMKQKQDLQVSVLVNMMNENGLISRSHGIPLYILQQQARAMQVPLMAIPTSWSEYEKKFTDALQNIREKFTVDTMVFGDIDLQAHRDWEEMVCTNAGLTANLPLWQKDRKQLIHEMLDAGIQTMIVSCNTILGEQFLGRIITKSLIPEFEELGVDPCGENGEFHTLVINCPLYAQKIVLPEYEKVKHEEYWFLKWKEGHTGISN
jgi:uncharacterized protein (TIGR00290 family)